MSTAHVPSSTQTVSRLRVAARVALGVTTALLCVLILTGPSLGAAGNVVAMQTTSPSPGGSAGPTKPSVAFLNPGPFDKGYPRPPRQSGVVDPPKISDRFDGVDRAYHVVAAVGNVPLNPVVEAYLRYPTATNTNEVTIGLLDRVPGTNTWELYWDIPTSFAEGSAVMTVRLYSQTASGIEEVDNHEMAVDMQHKETVVCPPMSQEECQVPPPDFPADETVEIAWPTNGGQLGFYKGASGPWRTVLEGSTSSAASELELWYTTSAPGTDPEYVQCGHVPLYGSPEFTGGALLDGEPSDVNGTTPIPWKASCALAAAVDPMDVVAVAAVPEEGDYPDRRDVGDANELTQESSDAHAVAPYIQDPAQFQVELDPNTSGGYSSVRRRVLAANACLAFLVTVSDHLDRPVQGANVDVHMTGPGDQAQFADDTTAADASGTFKAPDKGAHSEEAGKSCDGAANRGLQGDHNQPGAADIKHRESTGGSGVSGGGVPSGTPPFVGQWRFHIYSTAAGISNLTAWVDDEALGADGKREADDDLPEPTEASDTNFAQWYATAPTIDFDPAGGTSPAGTCFKYTARVRSGAAIVRDINVDVHAQGPDDSLDFCDVADGSPRRAPDKGPGDDASPHEADQADEAAHVGASPRAQHTEGETNDSGNFVFGLSSPIVGDTRITGWADGETRYRNARGELTTDNDIQDAGEPAKSVVHSWTSSAADASVRWVNPSGYGGAGGTKVSNKPDANTTYHLNARVDAADLIQGVEFLVSGDTGATFTKIGDATRVGSTDTYELAWDTTALAAKSYVVRARIVGTEKFEDRTVALDNTHETAEITRPANASQVSFSQNETTVTGVASAGAEEVNLFYTKLPARETHAAAGWIACGSIRLDGTGSQPQGFTAPCKLVSPDQAASVTGIAAVSVDCHDDFGCTGESPVGSSETPDSGDAHRIFGFDGRPLLALEPTESQSQTGNCTEMTLRVFDQSGQAIGDVNVDVHLSGPTEDVRFCDVLGGSARSNPADGGHEANAEDENSGSHPNTSGPRTLHTEGKTSNTGRFIFGVASPDVGDSQLTAWVDSTEDDTLDATESRDDATIHWVADGGGGNNTCTIEGTPGDDRLEGTPGADVICGLGGNDVLIGKGGNDILRGQVGQDDLNGGSGKDKLVGGADNDIAQGGGSVDVVKGGAGDDILRGRSAADLLIGYGGNDRLFGGGNNDRLRGGKGDDVLDGGNGRDACSGGAGANTVRRCE